MDADSRVMRSVRKLWASVEVFRALDPEIPSQTIAAFLLVAMNPGISVLEVQAKLGLANSSTSRNVASLTTVKRKNGKAGFGLVEYREDEQDRRTKNLYLTPKGAKFLNEVTEAAA